MINTFFSFIIDSLNNNMGVVTFLVGFTAIYLYVKQRTDKKRDAAKLILQEIRYAEQKVRVYLTHDKYKLWEKVLPTNNWNDNIHLFLKNMEESEIDLISSFYSKAMYIDVVICKISDMKNNLITAADPSSFPAGATGVENPQVAVQAVQIGELSVSILKETSQSIEFVYNTPAGEKLKKISRKRWYQFL